MNNPRPFNIRIFVAEGMPDGLRFVKKSNWVGQCIVCPRGRYTHVKKREEFSKSGVYLLIGHSSDEDDRPKIYVGEGEKILKRLDNHYADADKDFWSQAIVFTTKGDPLNKAQVKYLEVRLVELATKNNRCNLVNKNSPNRPSFSEAETAEIEGYLDELRSLLPVLGINAFESVESTRSDRREYHLKMKECDARGYETSSGFAVCAGSIARAETVASLQQSFQLKRERLLEQGVLEVTDSGLVFTIDQEFTSPSTAGTMVTGRNTNGREAWKDASGISLKEHQEREVEG